MIQGFIFVPWLLSSSMLKIINHRRTTSWLVFVASLISVARGINPNLPLELGQLSGVFCLLAVVLLVNKLIRVQKILVIVISVIGITLIALSDYSFVEQMIRAGQTNLPLIALLVSVSFLRLIIKENSKEHPLPKGDKEIWKTLWRSNQFISNDYFW